MKSKNYEWRIVKLKCETQIVPESHYTPYNYFALQQKRKKIYSDWKDIKWFSELDDAKKEMEDFIYSDNSNTNILTYSDVVII